jgi:hypothetical protein
MKTIIITGYDQNMRQIGDLCAASHQAYAIRHGYHFYQKHDYHADTHPSWQKMETVLAQLDVYDRVMWLDADTVITNPQMPIEEVLAYRPANALHVSTDWTHPNPEDEIKHFSLGNFVMHAGPEADDILYLASKRTEWSNRPLWEQQAIQEEYRSNERIRRHVTIHPRRSLNAVPALPTTTGPEPWQPGDFLCHMTFIPQEERVKLFPTYDIAGLQTLVPSIPEWHETSWCADIRHIACLRELLRYLRPGRAIEIGVWKGATSAAFVEAHRKGDIGKYIACDVGIQDEFLEVTKECEVDVRNQRSTEVLSQFETKDGLDMFVFVDGDHNLSTVAEETKELLRIRPRIVVMHDTRAEECGYGGCDGPPHMREALKAAGYTIIEDLKDRPEEATKRGFAAAIRDDGDVSLAQTAFDLTCY